MASDTPESGRKGLPWQRILLFVSLSANLLILGIFAGAHLSGRQKAQEPPIAEALPAGPYARALSRDGRKALRRNFETRRERFSEHRKNMRASARELAVALRAEPFEIEAVRDILSRQREVQIRLQDDGQLLFLKQIEEMTAEARSAFADNLERGLRRRKPK